MLGYAQLELLYVLAEYCSFFTDDMTYKDLIDYKNMYEIVVK